MARRQEGVVSSLVPAWCSPGQNCPRLWELVGGFGLHTVLSAQARVAVVTGRPRETRTQRNPQGLGGWLAPASFHELA